MSAHPVLAHTIAEAREHAAALRGRTPGASVALVPTMGALHAGHLALVERARQVADAVVVSIFVNPLQFAPSEDFEAYPRTLDTDMTVLATAGTDLVFAPSVTEMYPDGGAQTTVHAGPIGARYEGRSRPSHFDGMLTVVAKLLNIVQPDTAVFGRKDAQQLALVRRMVLDLNLPVTIEAVETVREPDGLALSSRNRYLAPRERRAAVRLHEALDAAASSADRGVNAAVAAAQSVVTGEPLITLDYLAVVDPNTFQPVSDSHRGTALAIIAAHVGSSRLIDNETITIP